MNKKFIIMLSIIIGILVAGGWLFLTEKSQQTVKPKGNIISNPSIIEDGNAGI